MPSPNAFNTYNSALAELADRTFEHPPPDMSVADRDIVLADDNDSLQLVWQAERQPFEAPPVRSVGARTPVAAFLPLARLLQFQADTEADSGDWIGCARSGEGLVRFGSQVQHDGAMLQRMIGMAMASAGRTAIRLALMHLSASTSLTLADSLRGCERMVPSYADALLQEQYACVSALVAMMNEPETWSLTRTDYYGSAPPSNQRIIDQCAGYFVRAMGQAIQPYRSARHIDPPSDALAADLVGGDNRLAFVVDRVDDELLIGQLALQSYSRANGHYPESLAKALARDPSIGQLDDPFAASGSLHYLGGGGGYLLYSVGPDGIDDGGRSQLGPNAPPPIRDPNPPPKHGDIVVGE